MSNLPHQIPQDWHDSLDELRGKVKLYPEDPEDQALRETDERRERIRNLVFSGELRTVIDESIDDPDLEV